MAESTPARAGLATREQLVDLISHDIRSGKYHPRERLIEVELAHHYGATRNAVRAALIEIAGLGLVEREPNRGARVRRVSIDEAIENTEVRLSLQAMCASKAAALATDADRAELSGLLDELRRAVAEDDRAANVAANAQISAVIRRISGHRTASRIIDSLSDQMHGNFYPYQLPDRRVESMKEYEQIVGSVIDGDSEGALAAARRHRDHVLEALRGIRDSMRDLGL